MFWHQLGVLAIALLSVLPAQLDAYVASATGCHHNGTWYADKSLVPTIEKCLNCQCNKKTLVCRLKVCPEMPMPPPRGCVVVQKKNSCCPYLSCARLDVFYKIPTKRRIIAYLDHYERESIDRVVNENMLQRRSDDSDVDLHVCVKNGTVYKSGSAMSSSNLCTYCYCIGGTEKCVKPKCMLPVEGCKPIFVDSTCCPVRYDCSTKTSGKSSQEVRYRKNSNKHFLRMSQRLQRNRGCTVGKQFYAEGQKMKSDPDKPCDICFCIRGNRRCAPKKCSPALKNCIPVVPKGQCCPSSYDCGSQKDYRRQNSRQFNLFSLLFGDENGEANATAIPVMYPHDRQPPKHGEFQTNKTGPSIPSTTERSIFDTIREGLEFIDGNSNQMLAENMDLVAMATERVPLIEPNSTEHSHSGSATTEVSFLDLLLGPTDELKNGNKIPSEMHDEKTTTTDSDGLSWVDLLLGPDEDEDNSTLKSTTSNGSATSLDDKQYTSIDRIGDDFDDFAGSGEIFVGDNDIPASTKEAQAATVTYASTIDITSPTTVLETEPIFHTTLTTMLDSNDGISMPLIPKMELNKTAATIQVTAAPGGIKQIPKTTEIPDDLLEKTDSLPLKEHKTNPTNLTAVKPQKQQPGLLSAILDGFTDILINKTTPISESTQNYTKLSEQSAAVIPSKVDITTSLPSMSTFKPLPSNKQNVRINSKITNLTVSPTTTAPKEALNVTFRPLPLLTESVKVPFPISMAAKTISTTGKPLTSTTLSTVTTKTTTTYTTSRPKIILTTSKPLIISTNPSILEADPFDKSAQPTLPPSLPNLKIIPFLPTDAVKADRNKPLYDFYHSKQQTAKIDYDLYDEANLYPSITEHFPSYPDLEDGSKAEYIYKFNVEAGPTAAVASAANKLDGSASATAYVKYDFVDGNTPSSGFSPPTKTEGGFMPKAPIIIDENLKQTDELNLNSNYQVTKHIIDITTSDPFSTKVIEITTPDPFKDVIRTEPPPDLTSLIEDKEKVIATKKQQLQPTVSVLTTMKPNHSNKISTEYNYSSSTQRPLMVSNETDDGKSTIEAFLEILLKEQELNAQENTTTVKTTTSTTSKPTRVSTIPPFKSLPTQTTIKILPTTLSMSTQRTPTRSSNKPLRTKTGVSSPSPVHRNKSKVKTQTRGNMSNKTVTTTLPKGNKTRHSASHRLATTKSPTAINATAKPRPKTTTTTTATTTVATTSTPATTTSKIIEIKTTSNKIFSISTTPNPFLMSPFDKLPFMDASFEVKPSTEAPFMKISPSNSNHNLMGLVHYKNSLNKYEGFDSSVYEPYITGGGGTLLNGQYKPLNLSPIFTTTTTTTTRAPPMANIQHATTNNLIDPTGILKLAGCNIYGRMYRVGRIILELSSPCLECKCTEVGVKCGPLDC